MDQFKARNKTNSRRFPGIKGRRPDRKAIRVAAAAERMEAYRALPESEKLLRNPKKALKLRPSAFDKS